MAIFDKKSSMAYLWLGNGRCWRTLTIITMTPVSLGYRVADTEAFRQASMPAVVDSKLTKC
ncbi:TPA: hypothetical protein EYN98_12775 [Candidatus Poribacteria bacterium]|nr:hypothetical protein [Candidatus Poribacteria bacterium]